MGHPPISTPGDGPIGIAQCSPDLEHVAPAQEIPAGSPNGTGVFLPSWLVPTKLLGHKRTRRGKRNRGKGKKGESSRADASLTDTEPEPVNPALIPTLELQDDEQMHPMAVLPTPKVSGELLTTQKFQQMRAVLLQHNLKQAAASFDKTAPTQNPSPSAVSTHQQQYPASPPAVGVPTATGGAPMASSSCRVSPAAAAASYGPSYSTTTLSTSRDPQLFESCSSDLFLQGMSPPSSNTLSLASSFPSGSSPRGQPPPPLQQQQQRLQQRLDMYPAALQRSWGTTSWANVPPSDLSSGALSTCTYGDSSSGYSCNSRESSAYSLSSSRLCFPGADASGSSTSYPGHLLREISLGPIHDAPVLHQSSLPPLQDEAAPGSMRQGIPIRHGSSDLAPFLAIATPTAAAAVAAAAVASQGPLIDIADLQQQLAGGSVRHSHSMPLPSFGSSLNRSIYGVEVQRASNSFTEPRSLNRSNYGLEVQRASNSFTERSSLNRSNYGLEVQRSASSFSERRERPPLVAVASEIQGPLEFPGMHSPGLVPAPAVDNAAASAVLQELERLKLHTERQGEAQMGQACGVPAVRPPGLQSSTLMGTSPSRHSSFGANQGLLQPQHQQVQLQLQQRLQQHHRQQQQLMEQLSFNQQQQQRLLEQQCEYQRRQQQQQQRRFSVPEDEAWLDPSHMNSQALALLQQYGVLGSTHIQGAPSGRHSSSG